MTYTLAELLHRTVGEVRGMSVDEFRGWVAYLNLKHEELKGHRVR